jgi:hypothetical protein
MTSSLVAAGSAAATPAVPASVATALARAGVPAAGIASPYGEVSRFGGYDETGTVPGKFNLPVGFAVDPSDSSTADHNAVYVLDRVVQEGERLGYRLQKLSSAGVVLGAVTLPVQEDASEEAANPMISLAVDSSAHRVYALVEGLVESRSGSGRFVPVAQRLVAWSTIPNASKQLVPAPGFPIDGPTGAALVAGQSVLEPGERSQALAAPEGLSVDPTDHNVAIEAQRGVVGLTGGPTMVQQIVTEGAHKGQLGESWTVNEEIAPAGERGTGLFATPGGFGVDLFQSLDRIARLVEVKRNFTKPEPALLAPDQSGGINVDESHSLDARRTSAAVGSFNSGALTVFTAGSPVTELTDGIYAGRYGQPNPGTVDAQSLVEPWNGVTRFWSQADFSSNGLANMGVRLFTANGTVITTIGGQPQGQACNIDTERLSLAAGSSGSVFVLTQPNEENNNSDDQVIKFAVGGKGACPQPSGSLTVNGTSGSSFSFPVGTQVSLADTTERKGGAPYRFDWVLLNSGTLEIEDLVNQMQAPEYLWPAPSTMHTFTKKGTYYLSATLYGDYGITLMTPEVVKITIH